MFKGILGQSSKLGHHMTRADRRLATVAAASAQGRRRRGGPQAHTYADVNPVLQGVATHRPRRNSNNKMNRFHLDSQSAAELLDAQNRNLSEEAARQRHYAGEGRGSRRHSNGPSSAMGEVEEDMEMEGMISSSYKSAQKVGHYDDLDPASGDSVIQNMFNELVRESLIRYGPPLPAEFVMDNDVVTSSSSNMAGAGSSTHSHRYSDSFVGEGKKGSRRLSWQQETGADGKSFMMYDEVSLKPHELLHAIRSLKPSFSIKDDCDGVPFSLMIKNCPYLRAFGGKVQYMRYLRRERISPTRSGGGATSQVVVSIAKYKMRESPSQDGIRQGPQPWLYSARMI